MSDEQNGHGLSRLDRMEGLMQLLIDDHLKFSDEHNRLLTAQIVLGDRLGKLTEEQKKTADAQKETHERLDALILTVDGMIRSRPE